MTEKIINHLPKISVVTVVLNDEINFIKTVENISKLSYGNLEYIVIDGGSTDGTLSVVEDFNSLIDKFISEEDEGLYDAMNKGIRLASGEWIIFMNAGDIFFDSNILLKIFSNKAYKNIDVIYGDTIVAYPGFKKYRKAGNIRDLAKGMQFSHQSAFVRLNYHKGNIFNIKNRICADFELFYSIFLQDGIFFYVKKTISLVIAGGISDNSRERVFFNYWKVTGLLKINSIVFYTCKIIWEFTKRIIKFITPNSVIKFIISKLL